MIAWGGLLALLVSSAALEAVYREQPLTFYCACRFDPETKVVDHASCDYQPIRHTFRSDRVEWEHVVPAEAFGRSFREWREGAPGCVSSKGPYAGRRCARRNPVFARMEDDPHNLVPAIGEVNSRRRNYSMAMIPGEAKAFGACYVEIEDRKVEPRPRVRGDVARIYQYMHAKYPGRGIISRRNRKLFEAWSRADPVDAWECRRAALITRRTGIENPLLARLCAGILEPPK